MSTINQIQLPNGSIYGFEDTFAREAASSKADKMTATASANGLMSAADKAKLDGQSCPKRKSRRSEMQLDKSL